MGKQKQPSTSRRTNSSKDGGGIGDKASSSLDDVLASMKMAQAVMHNDTQAMREILQQALDQGQKAPVTVHENVKIEKSIGESFTGGRSTPVYHVSCTVERKSSAATVIPTKKQRHFVVKLVLMPQNETTSDRQRRESYAVEGRFYHLANNHESEVHQKLRDQSLTIPKVWHQDLDPSSSRGRLAGPCFSILLNDVSIAYPRHPEFLNVTQAKSALLWIAQFHASFWGCHHEGASSWRRDLWTRGGFWTPKQMDLDKTKSNNSNGKDSFQLEHAQISNTTWLGTIRFLEQKYPSVLTPNTKGLGQRLQRAGPSIATFLSRQATTSSAGIGTMIHGDYKAANMFFASTAEEAVSASQVAVLDFQYTGGGLGVEDVAYLLYPDARGDFWEHEEELLETYHEELVTHLMMQQKGGPSTMPWTVFCRYYDLARLDMTRHWLCKQGWIASTLGESRLIQVLEESMNRLDGGSCLASDEDYQLALERFVANS